jgi:hypothetical protein
MDDNELIEKIFEQHSSYVSKSFVFQYRYFKFGISNVSKYFLLRTLQAILS